MVRYFRNSDFKKDKYFTSFFENLEFARKTNNKELEINIIRQYNNCSRARKLKGDIKIQDIFNAQLRDGNAVLLSHSHNGFVFQR